MSNELGHPPEVFGGGAFDVPALKPAQEGGLGSSSEPATDEVGSKEIAVRRLRAYSHQLLWLQPAFAGVVAQSHPHRRGLDLSFELGEPLALAQRLAVHGILEAGQLLLEVLDPGFQRLQVIRRGPAGR